MTDTSVIGGSMKQVTQIVFALMVAWGIAGCDRGGSVEVPAPATATQPVAESGAETIEALEDAEAAADDADQAEDEASDETSEAADDAITD